jgi:hypothetical protein
MLVSTSFAQYVSFEETYDESMLCWFTSEELDVLEITHNIFQEYA